MNKQEIEIFKEQLWMNSSVDLERKIDMLTESISKVVAINSDLQNDPRKALCKMKEAQLKKALEAYGTVDLSRQDLDRIPMIFARLQAEEARIRNDLVDMSHLTDGEKQLKKQLAIAKEILAEKTQPGGRA